MAGLPTGLAIGLEHHRAGDFAAAKAAYLQILRDRPDDADALCLLGSVRLAMGELREAVENLRAAIASRPGYPEAHNNLGVALAQLNELQEAEASFRECLRLRPSYAEAQNNLGDVLRRAGRFADAEQCFRDALAIRPDYPEALMNLGVSLADRGQFAQAISIHEKSLSVRPGSALGVMNLGNALRDSGRCEEAEAQYDNAIRLNPNLPEAVYNRGLNRLMMGDFERGWRDHESRLQCHSFDHRSCDLPMWDGSALHGRTILIRTEQGIGDTLQFIRYAKIAKERGGRVVVECPRALCGLLARMPGVDLLVPRGERVPPCDVYAPLMSMPRICGSSPGDLPRQVPYVFSEPERETRWRGRIRAASGFTIGVCWQGNPKYAADAQRSFPLKALAPVARLPGARLFSLQKGHGSDQVAGLGGLFEIEDLGQELDEGSGAFLDSAAALHSFDLVIAPDSALAHLAGAMGKTVWVPLPESAGWRWMLHRDDSPWYPTMRLFRTPHGGTWEDVFETIARDLSDRFLSLPGAVLVRISPGELIDRITILNIKSRRITDSSKLAMIQLQLDALCKARDLEIGSSPRLAQLAAELEFVNESIWECEEGLRACEAADDFGPAFVAFARTVYRDNDRRADLKHQIDALLNSPLYEVKSYRDC